MWLVCGLCLISLFVVCRAAPISKESSSNERGIYFDNSREKFANDSVCVSDDLLYKEDDAIPTASMCERCVCRPPDIVCETIKCEKNSGCRAIQRPNTCCPEYKCDCEADGRIYQNGERLEKPESPCRVCYCQSGEIVCTVIKCYTREDCMPRYVTGKCCPKYDHCPPVDPTPLMFYTTPETSSEPAKPSSIGNEADIAESSIISQESMQDNIVDTSKWTELSDKKGNSPISGPNTIDDYDKDISLIQVSAEISEKEKDDRKKLHKANTEVTAESQIIGETSKTEGIYKAKLQKDSTDIYTENTGTGEKSKRQQEHHTEGLQDNTEYYTASTGSGETSKRESNDKIELQQDNTEAYTERSGTRQMDKIEENDQEELQNNTEAYTESIGTTETRKRQHSDREEEEEKIKVYDISTGTGEMSKKEDSNKKEMQQESTDSYTESKGAGQTGKIEGKDKEELQDNTDISDTKERRKIEGNDKEEVQDNTEVYTENTSTGETSKIETNEKEELQGNTEAYTESTGTIQTTKIEGNEKEMQQDNTEIYTARTSEEVSKRERNENEELQHDDTEVYVESTSTGETGKTERNDKEELQEESTEVFTESTSYSIPTLVSEEDKTNILSGKITNKVAETWFEETATTPYYPTSESEEAKNKGNLDEEVSLADAIKTEDNGMVKDVGAVWYIGEVREAATESVTYETSQETEKHEITRNITEHNEGGIGTDPSRYESSVNSREGVVTGSARGDDDAESLIGSGEIGHGKYEDNTEAEKTENSQTTAVPVKYTHLTDKETVPVVTFQSNMELHHMDLVVPDFDNTNFQVDYDIKTTETNPVIGTESEINTISEYSGFTNVTIISTANDLNISGLDNKTFQNSSQESEKIHYVESNTSSLATSTASLTNNPTTDFMSELQNTETTESIETTTVRSVTAFSTKNHMSVASLPVHDSSITTRNEEITSSVVDSTTPDVLEGEHPLNAKESEQRTEHTEATVRETLQDVTAANSISDSNRMQESNTWLHSSDESVTHTAQTSASVTESDWPTTPADETERSIYLAAGSIEASGKILGSVDAFKSNKTANTTETSDLLPKEWLKTHQVTTVTNPYAEHVDEDKSQTVFNHDKAEEIMSTVNYSHDESNQSESGDRTDPSKGTDITNTEWVTEVMLTTSVILENTDNFDDYPSNKNDSQMLTNDFFNESRSGKEDNSDNASEEMKTTTGDQEISTTSNYNSDEREMPVWHNLVSQNGEKQSEMEGSDTSATDIIPQGDLSITGGVISGEPSENESWISDAVKNSPNKQQNDFDKNHPESFSTEIKSTDYERHESDKAVFAKEVHSAVYSSSSYEMNSHDFYGTGDYYVSSSESGLTYNITDVHNEATSTVISPSSEEQSADLMTARSTDNNNEMSTSQEYTNNETTMRPTESTVTNRTETVLESTTPRQLENVHYSGEITNSSEINIKNSFGDNQNADSRDTKLDENVPVWKVEPTSYESSDSHQEQNSTL